MYEIFTNRDLAARLEINLAKWKRWSRAFLPPDPLGGLQSGYARQYNFNDAFKVFLGGYLVGALKFSIPEARRILQDLNQWLIDHGFYQDLEETARPTPGADRHAREFRIDIRPLDPGPEPGRPFQYIISGLISDEPAVYQGDAVRHRFYSETTFPDRPADADSPLPADIRGINISALQRFFAAAVIPSNGK